MVDGREIKVLAERDPTSLPWKDMGVVCAVEATGGRVSGLWVREGEADTLIPATLVALGTNAINNAAVLIRSGLTSPQGAPHVGAPAQPPFRSKK